MTSPCMVQGAKLRPGPLKICKAAPRPTGFGENFSIRPAGRLKIFRQKPCTFSPRPYLPPETRLRLRSNRHKNFGEVVAGQFHGVCGSAFRVCLRRWCGDGVRRYSAHVGGFGGGGFPHPCRVAHSFRYPFPFRSSPFHHPFLRDTLKRNINH